MVSFGIGKPGKMEISVILSLIIIVVQKRTVPYIIQPKST
jgi:hypothetical protein